MKVCVYPRIEAFIEETFPLLMQDEVINNLIIGNALRAKEGIVSSCSWFYATIKDESERIHLIAFMTPPHGMLLYEVIEHDRALRALVDFLRLNNIKVQGVVTEPKLSSRFADYFCCSARSSYKEGLSLSIYRCCEVKHHAEVSGYLRKATEHDLYFLPFWYKEFIIDCRLNDSHDYGRILSIIDRQIKNQEINLWVDEYPVSQISHPRKTPNGIIISSVYTPVFFRNKGYASAIITACCQELLKKHSFVALFVDVTNDIAINLYKQIGFYEVGQYKEYFFD